MISYYMHRNSRGRRIIFVLCLLLLTAAGQANPTEKPYSPLEKSDYLQLTGAAKRSLYMKELSAYPSKKLSVQHRTLSITLERLPIEALFIKQTKKNIRREEKLRVMLLAAQHGTEISGCEALLMMAGDWVSGRNQPVWLNNMELLVIPAVNPDGIENKKRTNARGINLSTDYGLLASPESTAVNKALLEFKPHVVLDIHESALLKKKSLGAEGWLTDVEAQFEYANNPNVDEALQQFSADVMMLQILENVHKRGLRANRYIGEITNTGQVITHGGLSAHNLRNKAGLMGAASFLLENRLDVSTGSYPTPGNIRERVRKQILCINAFLSVCSKYSKQIVTLSNKSRTARSQKGTIWIKPSYVQDPASPFIEIPLRRIDTGKLLMHRFSYRKNISKGPATDLIEEYRIFSHPDFFADWLKKQGISWAQCETKTKSRCIKAKATGINGYLLPLYLEKKSASSILERLPFDSNDVQVQPGYRSSREEED